VHLTRIAGAAERVSHLNLDPRSRLSFNNLRHVKKLYHMNNIIIRRDIIYTLRRRFRKVNHPSSVNRGWCRVMLITLTWSKNVPSLGSILLSGYTLFIYFIVKENKRINEKQKVTDVTFFIVKSRLRSEPLKTDRRFNAIISMLI